MPPIPPEFVPILVQFPVVALVFAGSWVVLKWADKRANAELAREEARTAERRQAADAEVRRLREDMAKVRAEHRADLERLQDEFRAEITRLRSRNTQLQNQLDAARGKQQGGEK